MYKQFHAPSDKGTTFLQNRFFLEATENLPLRKDLVGEAAIAYFPSLECEHRIYGNGN